MSLGFPALALNCIPEAAKPSTHFQWLTRPLHLIDEKNEAWQESCLSLVTVDPSRVDPAAVSLDPHPSLKGKSSEKGLAGARWLESQDTSSLDCATSEVLRFNWAAMGEAES